MRILTIGVLTFIVWSTISTYLYVCKIKGLCNEPVTMQMSEVSTENKIAADSLQNLKVKEQLIVPKDLIIYFAFDKSEFISNDIAEKYFNESNTFLSQNKLAVLKITGHTDAIGTINYNQSLGYRRAQSMELFFRNKGLPADKIIIESKGENEPADNNNTNDGRANNRRTVITIKK
jgi:OmpA-OmpF porin, OOP family